MPRSPALPACRLLWGDLHIIGASWRHPLNDPFWRLYRNLDPGAQLITAGRRLDLPPGRPVLIPPWTACRAAASGRIRHAFLHFEAGAAAARPEQPLLLPAQPAWEAVLGALPFPDPVPAALALRCQAMLCEAMALATELGGAAAAPEATGRLDPLLAWIDAHLAEPMPVTRLARSSGIGREHFSRLFTRAMGVGPARYILRRRVMRAAELLRAGEGIEEAALAAGFADRYRLSHVFRRVLNASPAAYRRGDAAPQRASA